ncbi:N-carbamoylsarcosine amidase [Acrocarpospora pleiomorpha]|uniref:N-carbamoylsarcosine amidase n=1 Tax=Acrocarpospora pleiomorpha TaxID=90975 RepID=A0A5M3XW21_9ACTN|nr:isochorismatase family protein [Acrocarpospora pleiomorpha]GES24259.1 N-carbamoylsarcosine amidase [Acrocarpospora pleiomorpha]
MAVWDKFLTETDKSVLAVSGHGMNLELGSRPALLVIDVSYAFTGHVDEPITESVRTWYNSCGSYGWAAIPYIRQLLEAARSRNLPIFYSTGYDPRPDGFGEGLWRTVRQGEPPSVPGYGPQEIVREVAPQERDIVLHKRAPSVFFDTALKTYLRDLDADCLIVCGTTTCGCVRATVVDAFSYGINTVVAEEACFDRFESSHAMALFDMNAKYADVLPTSTIVKHLSGLPSDQFTGKIAPAMAEEPA